MTQVKCKNTCVLPIKSHSIYLKKVCPAITSKVKSFLSKQFLKKYFMNWLFLIGPKLLSMEIPIPNFCSWNRHGDSMSRSSEFGIPIEFQIPNFCPWNCYGNSMSRSSEFRMPLEFRIPNFCFWNSKCHIMDFSKNPKFFQLFILLTYK